MTRDSFLDIPQHSKRSKTRGDPREESTLVHNAMQAIESMSDYYKRMRLDFSVEVCGKILRALDGLLQKVP